MRGRVSTVYHVRDRGSDLTVRELPLLTETAPVETGPWNRSTVRVSPVTYIHDLWTYS